MSFQTKPGPTPGYTGHIPPDSSYLPDITARASDSGNQQEDGVGRFSQQSEQSSQQQSAGASSGGTGDYYDGAGGGFGGGDEIQDYKGTPAKQKDVPGA
ncbi:hypothetical protein HK097_002451 [Rhizophlyctis rosea]|uniref:Uncharacterized protein n=1 Tax=Rhizophlyctis rosea TaxID=64517 RepID=A0AAD5SAZ2_9FUNG|nr:hypothetical protein HK097_002451 [Rhizophlyctis rosea]